ncbi:hypothetical protein [uncultured Paraglaciecola sp.]|nr:hypothetical protein [uncultured Paraglaciecola sp.]
MSDQQTTNIMPSCPIAAPPRHGKLDRRRTSELGANLSHLSYVRL